MMFNVLALIILPPVFYFGTRWGTAGVAMGWVTVYPILVVLSFLRYALRAIEMRWSTYVAALIPAITASAAMTLAVWASRALMPAGWGVRPRFGIEVAAGVVGYCGMAWVAHRERIRALSKLLRNRGSAREREPAEGFQSEGHGIGPAKDVLVVPPAMP